ncbi:MAG: hypothetical protein ACXAEU_24815 [Candidatus Hodarchaeales archaeon]|jgi:hypothetical protein
MRILTGGLTPPLAPIQVGVGFTFVKMLIAPLISALSTNWHVGLVQACRPRGLIKNLLLIISKEVSFALLQAIKTSKLEIN